MAHSQRRKGWFAWLRGPDPAPRIDAADVGTAFGMELSLAPSDDAPRAPARSMPQSRRPPDDDHDDGEAGR